MMKIVLIILLTMLNAAAFADTGGITVAVAPFTAYDVTYEGSDFDGSPGAAQALASLIQAELSAIPGIELVERAELETAEKEIGFQLSGYGASGENSIKVGHWVGADILIKGKLGYGEDKEKEQNLYLSAIDLGKGVKLATVSIPTKRKQLYKELLTTKGEKAKDQSAKDRKYDWPFDLPINLDSFLFAMDHIDLAKIRPALDNLVKTAFQTYKDIRSLPSVAPLFFSNQSTHSDRLDYFEQDLLQMFLAEDKLHRRFRPVEFPCAGPSASEFYLAVSGLAEKRDQKVREVADFYVWGYFYETNYQDVAFNDVPVDLTIWTWDGASPPESLTLHSKVSELRSTSSNIFDAAVDRGFRTAKIIRPQADEREYVARQLYNEVLQRLSPRGIELGRGHGWQGNMRISSSVEGTDIKDAIRLLEIAHFFCPENAAIANCLVANSPVGFKPVLDWIQHVDRFGVLHPRDLYWGLSEFLARSGPCTVSSWLPSARLDREIREFRADWSKNLIKWTERRINSPTVTNCVPALMYYFPYLLDKIMDATQRVEFIELTYPLLYKAMDDDRWKAPDAFKDISIGLNALDFWASSAPRIKKAYIDAGIPDKVPRWQMDYSGTNLTQEAIRETKRKAEAQRWDALSRKHREMEQKDQEHRRKAEKEKRRIVCGVAPPVILPPELRVDIRPIPTDSIITCRGAETGRCRDMHATDDRLFFSIAYHKTNSLEDLSVLGYYQPSTHVAQVLTNSLTEEQCIDSFQVVGESIWCFTSGYGAFTINPSGYYGDRNGIPTLRIHASAVTDDRIYVGGGSESAVLGYYDRHRFAWVAIEPMHTRDNNGDLRCIPTIWSLEAKEPWLLTLNDSVSWHSHTTLAILDIRSGQWSDLSSLLEARFLSAGLPGQKLKLEEKMEDFRWWIGACAKCIKGDDSGFWIGGTFGLCHYDPAKDEYRLWGHRPMFFSIPSAEILRLRKTKSREKETAPWCDLSTVSSRLSGDVTALATDSKYLYAATAEIPFGACRIDNHPKIFVMEKETEKWVGQFSIPTNRIIDLITVNRDRIWFSAVNLGNQHSSAHDPLIYECDKSFLHNVNPSDCVADTIDDKYLCLSAQLLSSWEQAEFYFLHGNYDIVVTILATKPLSDLHSVELLLLAYSNDEYGLNKPDEEKKYLDELKTRFPGIYENYMSLKETGNESAAKP